MRLPIESSRIDTVFDLHLDASLICDSKDLFEIKICDKIMDGAYLTIVQSEGFKAHHYKEFDIELKGSVDVEDLRYQGNVFLSPIMSRYDCYKMHHIQLFKTDIRQYKRMPYSKAVKIKSTSESNANIVNISAGGVFMRTRTPIKATEVQITVPLQNREIVIDAEIIENSLDELRQMYSIRCRFTNIKPKAEQALHQLIMQLQIEARKRLQGIV